MAGGSSAALKSTALIATRSRRVSRVPRGGRQLGGDAEQHVALGLGIGVGEVVDQLLQAHCILGRQAAVVEETAHVGVGASIDIDAESRHRLLGHCLHRAALDPLVLLAVNVLVAKTGAVDSSAAGAIIGISCGTALRASIDPAATEGCGA